MEPEYPINNEIKHPIWVSVSEAAKLVGVGDKTIRRAIKDQELKYQVIKDRYSIDLVSVIKYMHKNTKLKNKLLEFGLGQYVDKWRD